MPSKRLKSKQSRPATTAVADEQERDPVNDYEVRDIPGEGDEQTGVSGLEPSGPSSSSADPNASSRKREGASGTQDLPDVKKTKFPDIPEDDFLLFNALQETECGYTMELDVHFKSHRELKKFLRSPSAFLVGKMRDCEVRWGQLRPEHKELFSRAKTKEVTSFIRQQAVRRCVDVEEEREARESGRVMKCRWVLTWKVIPEEERTEALMESRNNKLTTTTTRDGLKKAKARIVLLGYQHPDLLKEGFNSSAPVQSVLTRNVSYMMAVQNGWELEGLDLSTAFLQTAPKEEMRIWTVELRSYARPWASMTIS